jgi:hypothetical protein
MSVLFYRRPDYISKPNGPVNASDCAKYVERARSSERAIPPGLSCEEVINDKPLPVSIIMPAFERNLICSSRAL